jgi:hypothetical protein
VTPLPRRRATYAYKGYSYAGWSAAPAPRAIAATLSLDRVALPGQHFAVWLGVDGSARGRNVWLQTGIEREPQDDRPRLYVEVTEPGRPRQFFDLGEVDYGERLHLEVVHSPDGWLAVTPRGTRGPFSLPAAEATVTAEADGAASGQASAHHVRIAGEEGVWHRASRDVTHLLDPGWSWQRRRDGFTARR